MKTIIAGPRDFQITDEQVSFCIEGAMTYGIRVDELVCGMARGIDGCAYEYFRSVYPNRKIYEFHANWKRYGNSAGPRRNENMAENADALIAIGCPDVETKGSGTQHMIKCMLALKKRTVVFNRELKLIMAFEPESTLL